MLVTVPLAADTMKCVILRVKKILLLFTGKWA